MSDLIIIGTGAGGAALAYALKDSGMNVLLLERGDFLPGGSDLCSDATEFLCGKFDAVHGDDGDVLCHHGAGPRDAARVLYERRCKLVGSRRGGAAGGGLP